MRFSGGVFHQDLDGIEAIGVDEIQVATRASLPTLVYQIEDGLKRLLWVAEERTEEVCGVLPDPQRPGRQSIRFVCSDMWQPYLKVVASN